MSFHTDSFSVQTRGITGAQQPCVLASGYPAGRQPWPLFLQFSPFFNTQTVSLLWPLSCITYKHPSIVFKTSAKALFSLLVSKMKRFHCPSPCEMGLAHSQVSPSRESLEQAELAGTILLLSWSI